MQHDDSDIYTKQSESIYQENSNNIYSVILVNEHFVYKHICEGSILRAGLVSIYDIYKFYDICEKKGIYLIYGLRGCQE